MLVIDKGSIVASGTPDALKSSVGGDLLTVTATHAEQAGDIAGRMAGLPGSEAAQVAGDRVTCRVPAGGAALVALLRDLDAVGIEVAGVESRRPSLDDVFLTVTGRSLRDGEQTTEPDDATPAPEETRS